MRRLLVPDQSERRWGESLVSEPNNPHTTDKRESSLIRGMDSGCGSDRLLTFDRLLLGLPSCEPISFVLRPRHPGGTGSGLPLR